MGIVKLLSALIILLNVSLKEDALYENYAAAVRNRGTNQYYLVINMKNLNTGKIREICTQGNFLCGALHRELHIAYDIEGIKKVSQIAINNKKRYFEFKNDSAMSNLGINEYSPGDLQKLELQINFDSLAAEIKKTRDWSKNLGSDITISLWAHALFNRGILTAQNNCFGGTLHFVDIDYIYDRKK